MQQLTLAQRLCLVDVSWDIKILFDITFALEIK